MDEKIEKLKLEGKLEELNEVIFDDIPASKLNVLQQFTNAEFISLKNTGLANLKGFPKLQNLRKLDLSSNKLSSALFLLNGCSQLTHINLSGNNIKDILVLKSLGKLKNLQSLVLSNCEVTTLPEYRRRVFRQIKNLKDLDGEDKTADDTETPTIEETRPMEEDPMNGSGIRKGKKRRKEVTEEIAKRLKPSSIKNALMQLNELKPGLQYKVESMSGPAHNPEFVVTVEVNGCKYVGQGNSKQSAKHNAAHVALSSLIQFPNTPSVAATLMKPFDSYDFATDIKNDEYGFNKFETHRNGSGSPNKMDTSSGIPAKSSKILTEADKKNPVMLLNEIHPALTYQLVDENSTVPSQRFRMTVEVDGIVYEGTGPNKKQAKASAARSVMSNLYNVTYNTYGAQLLPISEAEDAELFNFSQAVADKISKSLINSYNEVMVGNSEYAKWKIIAGIAMTKDEAMQDVQIISIGTGTKCINGAHISMIGANLNDCHAEIISRRCLKDFFYTNLELHLEGEGDQSIFMRREGGGGFCLKPHIKFHLYISTAPCGDARIFCPHEDGALEAIDRHPNRNSRGVLRTKIESGEGTIPIRSGQGIQTWDGILPGQERLLTMSCSDKIAAWNVLGLQGAFLSHFIEPVYLESVILGGLFHPNHLRRALFSRFEKYLKDLPPLYRLNKPKMCAITSPETRHLVKSPNHSVNWTTGLGRAEVVNATTGKTETGNVSRLSKRSFFQRFMNIYDRLSHIDRYATPQPALYGMYKEVVKDYQAAKKCLTSACAEAGLGNWVKKPIEQNEFELVF